MSRPAAAPPAPVAAGAALGAAVALGLAVFDAVVPPGAHEVASLARTLRLAPGLVGSLVPLAAALGAAAAWLRVVGGRLAPRWLEGLDRLAFAGCGVAALAVAGYWAWRSGDVQLEIGLGRAAGAVALGLAGFAATVWTWRWLAAGRAATARRSLLAVVCAAWVAAVAAGAIGLAGDGVPAAFPPSRAGRPDILLVVVDTLRADHLSCYGYSRETTPNLDAFARDARRYTNVLSPGSWTLPSHASLFTGVPSSVHGCNWSWIELDEDLVTLAELLRGAGYQTVGLSSNGFLNPANGFAQGFDTFYSPWAERSRLRTVIDRAGQVLGAGNLGTRDADSRATLVNRRLGRWFRHEYDPSRPYFVFVNYLEPHVPYVPVRGALQWADPEWVRRWAAVDQGDLLFSYGFSGATALTERQVDELLALYDEEVRYVDGKVGELLAALRGGGSLDSTLVAITSDHGEHFAEHGLMEHQYSVYEALVRVPLLVRYPGRLAPGVDDSLVQTHDLFATALDAAGVVWERGPAHTCRSLFGPDGGEPEERLAVSEYLWPAIVELANRQRRLGAPAAVRLERFMRRLRAVQQGHHKLIRGSDGDLELYDLAADPAEARDLAAARPELAAALATALDEWVAKLPPLDPDRRRGGPASGLSRGRLEELRALGYLR